MLCSRWFSLKNLAYTAALILPLLLQGGSELLREQLGEMVHEGQHVCRQPLVIPNLEPLRRRTHGYIIDTVYQYSRCRREVPGDSRKVDLDAHIEGFGELGQGGDARSL